MIISGFIHVAADGTVSRFVAEYSSIACMNHIFLPTPLVSGQSGGLRGLAVVNRAAVNTGVHVSFGTMVFSRWSVCLLVPLSCVGHLPAEGVW